MLALNRSLLNREYILMNVLKALASIISMCNLHVIFLPICGVVFIGRPLCRCLGADPSVGTDRNNSYLSGCCLDTDLPKRYLGSDLVTCGRIPWKAPTLLMTPHLTLNGVSLGGEYELGDRASGPSEGSMGITFGSRNSAYFITPNGLQVRSVLYATFML
jgi:hypothetical protein